MLQVAEGGNIAIGRVLNFHVKVYSYIGASTIVARANVSISVPKTPSLDIAVQLSFTMMVP